MLAAEGEIGTGRDISQAVPGGFSAAGAINGNLRARAAAILLQGALGTRVANIPGANAGYDDFDVADDLPLFTIEKKVGTVDPELLVLRYQDSMINTLNLTIPNGGLATFSAGLVAAGEAKQTAAIAVPSFPASSDDLLLFHGGRIRNAATGTTLTTTHDDATFQSFEAVINNNVATDEYTIRPSRFLRSLTEGIRSIEANLTVIFENDEKYEQYTYGATGRTTPGYSLYMGAINVFLGNWQIAAADSIQTLAPTGAPVNPQGIEINIPKLAFSGLPVALATGRIAVSTTARALKPSTGNIITTRVRPTAAGIDYA